MEFPCKSFLFLFLVTYIVNVGYGFPDPPLYPNTFGNPQFVPSGANTYGNPQLPVANTFGNPQLPVANTYGNPQLPVANTFGNPQLPVANTYGNPQYPVANTYGNPQYPVANTYGNPQSGFDTSDLRNPLFPSVVQDFVEDALRSLIPFFSDFDIKSIRNLSADQIFSIFYDIVYRSNVEQRDPSAKFHAFSKAQSIRENYDKVDGKFLILVSAYTTGELLLQYEILNEGNQKSLSELFANDFLESIKSGPNDPESHIRSSHVGYVKFLRSQGFGTKDKAFVPAAVYVEVIYALAKNYQIPPNSPYPSSY